MAGLLNSILSIIEFVIALSILAFLHELGHFLAMRASKIEVEEFGFGFPPRLVKLFTWRGTEFTLNWIPFGAFVRPKAENDPAVPGGLGAASPWKRLAVMLGGPALNIITGILLFILVFVQVGAPDTNKVIISDVVSGSPAAQAGMKANDLILQVQGQPITSTASMSSIVQANLGKSITIQYQRDGQTAELNATPRVNPPSGQGPLGVVLTNPLVPTTLIQAVPLSLKSTGLYIDQLLLLPGRLIQGQLTPEQSRIVGPVGMYDIFSQERSLDIQSGSTPTSTPPINVLNFLAVISVALGFTNLLPLPALDGGHILFLIPELLFRKRVPPRFENAVHVVGLFLFIMLMVFVTIQDIINPVTLPK